MKRACHGKVPAPPSHADRRVSGRRNAFQVPYAYQSPPDRLTRILVGYRRNQRRSLSMGLTATGRTGKAAHAITLRSPNCARTTASPDLHSSVGGNPSLGPNAFSSSSSASLLLTLGSGLKSYLTLAAATSSRGGPPRIASTSASVIPI